MRRHNGIVSFSHCSAIVSQAWGVNFFTIFTLLKNVSLWIIFLILLWRFTQSVTHRLCLRFDRTPNRSIQPPHFEIQSLNHLVPFTCSYYGVQWTPLIECHHDTYETFGPQVVRIQRDPIQWLNFTMRNQISGAETRNRIKSTQFGSRKR